MKHLKYFILIAQINLFSSSITERIFTHIYKTNLWGDDESISGTGSNLESTKIIRAEIPKIIIDLGINSVLDAPCGDFYWMKEIIDDLNINSYLGVDIVQEIIKSNIEKYTTSKTSFKHLNLITDPLPCVDLVICRDCIVHFSQEDIIKAIKNLKASGSKYILMTHFEKNRKFVEIRTGEWRPVNFTMAPFRFPKPIKLIMEGCKNYSFEDKTLSLWRLQDLNV